LGSVSLFLLKLLNSRRKKTNKAPQKVDSSEKQLDASLSKILGDWKEYLHWIEDCLSLLSLIMNKQQIEPIVNELQFQTIINATKTLQIVIKSVQSVLNFSVLTRVLARKVVHVTFGKYSSLIWLGVITFLNSQLKDLLPQVTFQTTRLWNVANGILSFLKGPLKHYCFDLLEDIEEANPELFKKLQARLQSIETIFTLPKMVLQKGTDILKFSETQMRPMIYTYLLPHVQNILIRSYQAYFLTKESLSDMSPMDLLTGLIQMEWSQQLIQSLTKYSLWLKRGSWDKAVTNRM